MAVIQECGGEEEAEEAGGVLATNSFLNCLIILSSDGRLRKREKRGCTNT